MSTIGGSTVVSHQQDRDTVESFIFLPHERRLKHRATFAHPLLRQLNNIVVVRMDEFYVTVDHYFSGVVAKEIEALLRLPLCSTVRCLECHKTVASGLQWNSSEQQQKVSNGLYTIMVINTWL